MSKVIRHLILIAATIACSLAGDFAQACMGGHADLQSRAGGTLTDNRAFEIQCLSE